MIKVPIFNEEHLIEHPMLKNGWQSNGKSYYSIIGNIAIIYITIRYGNVGVAGTELFKLPLAPKTMSFVYNENKSNGAIFINEDGMVGILDDVINPLSSNIKCTLFTVLK